MRQGVGRGAWPAKAHLHLQGLEVFGQGRSGGEEETLYLSSLNCYDKNITGWEHCRVRFIYHG